MPKTVSTYFAQVQEALNSVNVEVVEQIIQLLLEANEREASIYVFGNGGSAATASHFATDLGKGAIVPGQKRFRVVSLTDNVPLITAWANDTAYENIFSEQLRGLIRPGDIVIGISGSGNSQNVLNAIRVGSEAGAITVGWSGYGGGKLAKMVDLSLDIECNVMEQVEDVHMSLGHNICTHLRLALRGRTAAIVFADALVEV